MTGVPRFLVGLLIGAAVAGVGLMVLREPAEETTGTTIAAAATTTAAPAPVEPDWIPDGGVRFASTVLVPNELSVSDGVVRLRYDLVPLGQVNFTFAESLPGALPERWELRLADGRIVEAETAPPNIEPFNAGTIPPDRRLRATVSFEVGEVTQDDVVAVVVTGWRLPVPVVTEFSVDPAEGQRIELFDGSVVTLTTLLEQRSTTIIGFSMDRTSDAWRTEIDLPFRDSFVFRGAGPGWISASSTIGGTSGGGSGGGSTGFQLTWGEPTAPEEVAVRFATTSWLAVDTRLVVVGAA